MKEKIIWKSEFEDYKPPGWDEFFIKMCYLIATKSKDLSSKIGSVVVRDNIIISTGYNGFPKGVKDSIVRIKNRDIKYQISVHSEVNSLLFAAKYGAQLNGSKLYTSSLPCQNCGKHIIQAGISEVIYHKQFFDFWNQNMRPEWEKSNKLTKTMFKEAGIRVRGFSGYLGEKAYVNGKITIL